MVGIAIKSYIYYYNTTDNSGIIDELILIILIDSLECF